MLRKRLPRAVKDPRKAHQVPALPPVRRTTAPAPTPMRPFNVTGPPQFQFDPPTQHLRRDDPNFHQTQCGTGTCWMAAINNAAGRPIVTPASMARANRAGLTEYTEVPDRAQKESREGPRTYLQRTYFKTADPLQAFGKEVRKKSEGRNPTTELGHHGISYTELDANQALMAYHGLVVHKKPVVISSDLHAITLKRGRIHDSNIPYPVTLDDYRAARPWFLPNEGAVIEHIPQRGPFFTRPSKKAREVERRGSLTSALVESRKTAHEESRQRATKRAHERVAGPGPATRTRVIKEQLLWPPVL